MGKRRNAIDRARYNYVVALRKEKGKSCCLNRQVICPIPKFGGNMSYRPDVLSKKDLISDVESK